MPFSLLSRADTLEVEAEDSWAITCGSWLRVVNAKLGTGIPLLQNGPLHLLQDAMGPGLLPGRTRYLVGATYPK